MLKVERALAERQPMGIPAQGTGTAPGEAVPQYTSLREPTGGQREQSEIQKTWCWAGAVAQGGMVTLKDYIVHRRLWGEARTALTYAKACCKEENKLISISSEDKGKKSRG